MICFRLAVCCTGCWRAGFLLGHPTVLSTLSSIQSHNPVPPAELGNDINRDLSDLTLCLLEKQPINRPQSCEQLVELLTTPRKQWPMVVPCLFVSRCCKQASQPLAGPPANPGKFRARMVGLDNRCHWTAATGRIRLAVRHPNHPH